MCADCVCVKGHSANLRPAGSQALVAVGNQSHQLILLALEIIEENHNYYFNIKSTVLIALNWA